MKKLDITSVVSLIVSSIAILISILGVLYSRRRTKLMEQQLEQQREQLNKKKRYEEVSKNILQAVRIIKKYSGLEYFHTPWMPEMSSEVLGFMHDNQLKTFVLNVKPQKLRIFCQSEEKEYVTKDFKQIEKIVSAVESEITRSPNNVTGSVFYFDCDPSILSNPWIELVDALDSVEELYLAYGSLKNHEDEIAFFDSTVLDDLKQNIDSILRVLLESLASEHKISFSSTDKSKQILRKLQNEMTGLESINVLLKELSVELCDKRLIPTQREIFSKS